MMLDAKQFVWNVISSLFPSLNVPSDKYFAKTGELAKEFGENDESAATTERGVNAIIRREQIRQDNKQPLMGGGESLSPLPALKEAIDALPKLGRFNSARTLANYNFQLQQVKAALTEITRRNG